MVPFISVVIPLYNKEKYIKATLISVLNQTFNDFEVIIINDGSTDRSLEIVENIKNNKIAIYTNKNQGLSFSRNYGIKKAKGKYVAFLDADDLWREDYLKTIFNLIVIHKKYNVFATNFGLLNPNYKPNLYTKTFDKKNVKIISDYFNMNKNILTPSSIVINKNVFKNIGYFNESVNYGEEYDFYIRCFSRYDLIYYSEFKVYYRINVPNQLTAPNKNFYKKLPDYEMLLKTYDCKHLKKFVDFAHYELVVLYKMERNKKMVNFYKTKINTNNLNKIQRLKFWLPIPAFYWSKLIYNWFSNKFINLLYFLLII
ncbi:glycosyltransferase family 2 protein [Aestuariibaculum sediminum]|uniref:Glycosyltransferase family 2 protein n=1 Tax=Aestuariibaculum sediminum TaxID=2770637 RepID=A0A8J6Q0X4_9FLAO|nr:glycosyltransferase family A protein [Aestuariibaculum sediminum]MBD0830554.1 glycosyltransferase family 2 protein [Aestuariibaculum sediminum]